MAKLCKGCGLIAVFLCRERSQDCDSTSMLHMKVIKNRQTFLCTIRINFGSGNAARINNLHICSQASQRGYEDTLSARCYPLLLNSLLDSEANQLVIIAD